MKRSIVSVGLIFSLLFMASCVQKETEISTRVQAYPLSETHLKVTKMSIIAHDFDYGGENVLEYKNEDGTKSIYVFSAPIENSENKIAKLDQGEYKEQGYGYLAGGNYIQKLLPDRWSQNCGMKTEYGTNYIEVFPADDAEYASKQGNVSNAFGQVRDEVTYADAFGKGIDYRCYVTSFGVNTEIILPKRNDKNTFQIKVKLPELVPDTASPDYILMKTALEKGEVKAILYTPLAVDKNGNWCYANSIKLVNKDSTTGTYTVEYSVDEAFLKDKATKYPVTLNQSIHLYKSKQPDTSAYEKTGDEAGHYLSPYMLLGDKTLKGEGWTYIRYETLNNLNIDADKVISAKYVFRNLFDLPKDVKVGAYAVTADWCSINTRWFNRPPFDERPISQTNVQKAGDYSVDITPLFKEMIRNKGIKDANYSVQNSFFIRCDTPGSNMIFPSGDNGLFSPFLEVIMAQ